MTNTTQNFALHSTRKICILTVIMTAIALAVICSHIWYGDYTDQTLRFADSGTAMITSSDGFFYLTEAKRYLAQGGSVPALARLTAFVHSMTGFELTDVAFWLPVFLTFLLCFVYTAWAVLLGFSPWIAGLAVIFGTFMPAWIERSRMGWFDTDPGIAFLWQACLVSTAFLAMPQRRFSWQAFACMLISGGLLAWWWKPGMLLLPACFAIWGVAFLWAKDKQEKRLRLMVFLGMMLLGVAIAIGLFFMPNIQLSAVYTYALDHFRLAAGITGNAITNSILELKNMPIDQALTLVGGSPWGGSLIVVSLGIFCIFKRHAAFILLPALILLSFGFFSKRFMYFGAVPIGLAMAWSIQQILGLAKLGTIRMLDARTPAFETWGRGKLSAFFKLRFSAAFSLRLVVFRFIAVSFACIIFFSQAHWLFNWLPEKYFLNGHDKIAMELRRKTPPNAPVWAWWDDGYFLRARTGLSPMFDGGSQTPFNGAVIARPFMTEDTRFSRRWIRFFALRGFDALNPLVGAWGGQDATWALVEKIFSADQPEVILATLPPVKTSAGGIHDYLFPEGRVFMYLSQRILRLSRSWGNIGLYKYPTKDQKKSYLNVFERGTFHYTPSINLLRLPDSALEKGYVGVSAVYVTNQKPLIAPWPKYEGVFAVASPHSRWLYFANLKGLTSLPLRLMAPAGVELDGFHLISADYDYAGAWEVLP